MLNKPEPEKPLGGHIINRRSHAKNTPTACESCGLGFAENEKIVSHKRHGRDGETLRVYFHLKCWDRKFYDSSVSDSEVDAELLTLELEVARRKMFEAVAKVDVLREALS